MGSRCGHAAAECTCKGLPNLGSSSLDVQSCGGLGLMKGAVEGLLACALADCWSPVVRDDSH